MTSIFQSWIGSTKLSASNEDGEADTNAPSSTRSVASGSTSATAVPMSPDSRAAPTTPKAPMHFGSHSDRFTQANDHHREASDATLNGRLSGHFPTDGSAHEYVYRTSISEHAENRVSRSRPTGSSAFGSEFSHTRLANLSSASGGADSEVVWASSQTPTQATDSNRNSAQRKRRKVAPPELLVIVKPPPSKQVNPLNLQIQLVMPQQLQRREGSTRRASLDSSAAPAEMASASSSNELRRRDSIGSTRSAGSEISTAGSVGSTASGKRVTPLYNLNFHSILSTTVSDAGTDQKIAKYIKKGIDLDGFGVIEPAELISGVNDLATLSRGGLNATGIDSTKRGPSSASTEEESVFSAPPHEQHGSASATAQSEDGEPPTSFQAMTPEARGVEGNLGGKLLGKFKRFSLGVKQGSAGSLIGSNTRDTSSLTEKHAGGSSGVSLFGKLGDGGKSLAGSNEIPQLTPGAGVADGKRTEGYYWTVRKWNRRAQDGISGGAASRSHAVVHADGSNPVLSSVWKRFNVVNRMGGNELHPPAHEIPVRFEWTRNTKMLHRRRKTEEAQARLRASASLNASRSSLDKLGRASLDPSRSRTSLQYGQPHAPISKEPLPMASAASASAQSLGADKDSAAVAKVAPAESLKPESRRSSFVPGSRSPRRSVDTSAAGSSVLGDDAHGEDSGEESDPEDSETPWNCHLVLGPTTRIPLGTLSPAPHHPKLVGQLAVPFPLPDLSATGLGPDGAGLTREELKDIIIVTCLHLIVRENFGGLARRKSNASVESGINSTGITNVNGWRLANLPKKQ